VVILQLNRNWVLEEFLESHPYAESGQPWEKKCGQVEDGHRIELVLQPCLQEQDLAVTKAPMVHLCRCKPDPVGNLADFFEHFARHLSTVKGEHSSTFLFEDGQLVAPAWTPPTFKSVIRNAVSVVLPCSLSGQANLTFFMSAIGHVGW
jgi:hypothetical protein